ncbi:MAG: DUF4241 domain-containing protein [Saprospiraceae bacterium]|nr:DUF4241 domain-containing protein [Saprospiraceae bacterium]
MVIPNYLERAFQPNFRISQAYEFQNEADSEGAEISTLAFTVKNLGRLKIKQGRIIACDPFDGYDDVSIKPIKADFPKGKYLCEVSVACIDDTAEEYVGFARIRFSNELPVRWELAVREGENVADFATKEFGYPVESGIGGFMDISAQREYKMCLKKNEDYWDEIEDEMAEREEKACGSIIWSMDDSNMALFPSGYGDGKYPTYIGYDDQGKICRLVTDFLIMDDESEILE